MSHGGARKGAGRKALPKRKTEDRVRAASEEIDKAQPLAVRALLEALQAKVRVGKRWVPDHPTRVRAAGMILNKRIPDVARTEFADPNGKPVNLGVILYPPKKKEGEA